ncbi:CHAT domain-containing protein [Catellatospora paridis]|uniref:CHAT domain-containing protein n=1 Tax=Catellatospora paridis TaxID=1617086 RepID=UPI0012D37DEF|nr:CHAT domain-containing protein [Catellatospora paridis]
MSEVIATVSIRAPRSGPGVEVCFEFPATGETVYLPLPDRRALEAMRRKAGEYLHRVVPLVARLNATAEQAATALRILLNAGRELTGVLIPDDISRFLRLESAFRAAWPRWQAADWDDPHRPIPMVELHCHDETLPLELLPLFDFGSLPPLRTYDDLVRAASRFLGFATVVRRVVPARATADSVLRNEPALPVQFLRHRELGSARDEERFLTSLGAHVQVEGPWPVAQDEEAVRTSLLRALYDGAPLDGGTGGGTPVQVQHFACHCDTSAEFDDDYALVLSTRNGKTRRVTFGELREGYYDRFFADRSTAGHRAVIILNACASSRTNPLTAYSFPRWFLNHGHRAFIGTETDVPDGVAGGFAAAFYGRLLEARRPLGEAVVWARRDLLRDFRNPLGLLYVMYGDTQLTVERARPGIYRASAGRAA